MDSVLGVSMAPASVQMVLLQGENAEGITLDEKEFAVTATDDSPTVSASDRVIAAILGTRDDAAAAGLELSAVGVAYTDQLEATALRDALASHRVENVMLVSAFLATAALTQSVGGAMGYERTAVLFLEPDTATLAIVETSDGSVSEVHTEKLKAAPGQVPTAELMELVAGLDALPTLPGGLFVVGSGVDIAPIKPHLEEATSLTVSVPEEPETALARGAALVSATAPLFASSTAALAYALDPGTGAIDASALPEYLTIAGAEPGDDDLASSAVADDEANTPTVVIDGAPAQGERRRRPGLLVGSVLAVAGFSAGLALEAALTVGVVHTTVGLLPAPLHNFIAPFEQALPALPGQVAPTKAIPPKPLSQPAGAPPPAAPAPAAPIPAAPVPAPPVPAAPVVPVPVVLPPIAPIPVPPIHLPSPPASPPVIQAPPHSPPIHVPPVHPQPPQQTPPGEEQSPHPGGVGGGPTGHPEGGEPVDGPSPVHGNPGGGEPQGGGPVSGPAPTHGTPGGAPPEGGGPAGGGGPVGGGAPAGGGAEPGGGSPGGGSFGGGSSPGGGGFGGGSSPSGGSSGGGSFGGGGSPSGGSPSGGSSGGGSSGGAGHH